jgi:hypothetical protein
MNNLKTIASDELEKFKITIQEPFAEFLMADQDEYKFKISLLDVVRFAGHACPSMVGAFLISQRAVTELFPETNVCIRGQVAIEIPSAVTQGATGPISNVFSMIFGAWERSGFGGLQGQFVRRGLLKYDVQDVSQGTFRFHNLKTGNAVDISYDPSKAQVPVEAASLPFQKVWRHKIATILENSKDYINSRNVNSK